MRFGITLLLALALCASAFAGNLNLEQENLEVLDRKLTLTTAAVLLGLDGKTLTATEAGLINLVAAEMTAAEKAKQPIADYAAETIWVVSPFESVAHKYKPRKKILAPSTSDKNTWFRDRFQGEWRVCVASGLLSAEQEKREKSSASVIECMKARGWGYISSVPFTKLDYSPALRSLELRRILETR